MVPQFRKLHLSQQFESVDFLSDLHLETSHEATFNAWKKYMQTTEGDAIFILGDLFESWVGADILEASSPLGDFERQCAQVIKEAADKSIIYMIPGNRDFLLSQDFCDATDSTLLPDPTLLYWANHRVIITHGDLLCTDDIPYQEYRKMVHNPAWQAQALAMPLEQRLMVAQQMRMQSEQAKKSNAADIMDVNAEVVGLWMQEADATRMIHGHTHRPQNHLLANGLERIVLSDWDLDITGEKQRAEILQWSIKDGLKRIAIPG